MIPASFRPVVNREIRQHIPPKYFYIGKYPAFTQVSYERNIDSMLLKRVSIYVLPLNLDPQKSSWFVEIPQASEKDVVYMRIATLLNHQ